MEYNRNLKNFLVDSSLTMEDLSNYLCKDKIQFGAKVCDVTLNRNELLFGNYCYAISNVLCRKSLIGTNVTDLANKSKEYQQGVLDMVTAILSREVIGLITFDGDIAREFKYPKINLYSDKTFLGNVGYMDDIIEFTLLQMGYRITERCKDDSPYVFDNNRMLNYYDGRSYQKSIIFKLSPCEKMSIQDAKNSIDAKRNRRK